jgi:hypothetical protein
LPAQYSVFKALGLKIKFLNGSLVFINLENSIGFGAEFALLKPRFLVGGVDFVKINPLFWV